MKALMDLKNGVMLLDYDGYNDGYYWDERYLFKYKDKYFVFMDVGSFSGYIPNYGAIRYVGKDQSDLSKYLKSWDEELKDVSDDVHIPEALSSYADRLIASNEDEIELWSEED